MTASPARSGGVRVAAYRALLRGLHRSGCVDRIAGTERARRQLEDWADLDWPGKTAERRKRVWIHAASAGELEILWPVAEQLATDEMEFVLTVLSPSARTKVRELAEALGRRGARVLVSGYSPLEGRWDEALRQAAPSVFVTAKYEAWPELWLSLADHQIPLVVVDGRMRRSLAISSSICRLLGSPLPRMSFSCVLPEEQMGLQRAFPECETRLTGDPRWDRVFERSALGSPRARALVESCGDLPRPWGVLGSAWKEDLAVWAKAWPALSEAERRGTLWIVPHRVDEEHLHEMESCLRNEMGFSPLRTSKRENIVRAASGSCLLVDEMGFLSELYASADWAYVGGGFGEGIHSTIEPAIHGIPLAGGKNGASRFPEIQELSATRQFRSIASPDDLVAWLRDRSLDGRTQTQAQWRLDAELRRGAAARVARRIETAMIGAPVCVAPEHMLP
jgi:3-deoxy-D-manno-octulosonic-acid transferase